MSEFEKRITDEEIEAYLEGSLSDMERAEFEGRLATDAEARQRLELYEALDTRLRQVFAPPSRSQKDIERLLAGAERAQPRAISPRARRSRRTLLLLASGLAAAAAWAVVAWQWGSSPRLEPFFQPRPLADIYRETVTRGFRPYYLCEDEQRFAMTFLQRQDVPLQLAQLPQDRRMVGLSYLGGLSRDTTAMLGYVEDRPVIVFIDRREHDQPTAVAGSGPDLHVHRKQLGQLVMYEVTPLDSPSLLDYLQIPGGGV